MDHDFELASFDRTGRHIFDKEKLLSVYDQTVAAGTDLPEGRALALLGLGDGVGGFGDARDDRAVIAALEALVLEMEAWLRLVRPRAIPNRSDKNA